jgi:hypothetical protein
VETDWVDYVTDSTTATCMSAICVATSSINVTADLTVGFDPTYGVWRGSYSNSIAESGEAAAFLSPDGAFAAIWLCNSGATAWAWPDDCDFALMNRP